MSVTILRNGVPVEARPFTRVTQPVVELSGWRWGTDETPEQRARQLHVVLPEPPEPGDDLTYSDLAPEYDKVYVRWSRNGMTYVMRIEEQAK